MNVNNLGNEYMRRLSYFNRIPKSVLAAIAVSYASQGGDYLELADARVAREWTVLSENGIVPQRPPSDVRKLGEESR